ncbi:MAG TPA: tetratricopeptide repeat protein [bacterium]
MKDGSKDGRPAAILALAVALLAALPYLIAGLPDGFLQFDDNEYVVDNPRVRTGLTLAGVRWALTSFHSANWHPLTWLSHMLDVQLFGLDPRGHHATSVLLHALAAALLFLAAHRLTGMRWRSALVAALFAVHPLRVESVAWVAERKDVLAGVFFMLVLLAYERAARRGDPGRSPWVPLFLALGLMAKPMLVTVPCVLLLLDWWPLGRALPAAAARGPRFRARLIAEKLPLFALAAFSAAITLVAQTEARAIVVMPAATAAARVLNASSSVITYVVQTVWPADLALFYPLATTPAPWTAGAIACVGLLVVTAALVRSRPTLPFLATGWLWFLGMLAPVLGLVQVGYQAHADRYTYLPQIGLTVAAVWGAATLAGRWRVRRLAPAAGAATIAALATIATTQAGLWRDGETIFRHTLAVTRDNWLVRGNLGFLLFSQGRYAEAEPELREAVRINPAFSSAQNNLGNVLALTGRAAEAIPAFRAAIAADPRNAQASANLGNALAEVGRLDEAAEAYRAAIRLDPAGAVARVNLGAILANAGRLPEAEALFRETTRLRPDSSEAWQALGRALALLGRRDEALAAQREAERLRAAGARR